MAGNLRPPVSVPSSHRLTMEGALFRQLQPVQKLCLRVSRGLCYLPGLARENRCRVQLPLLLQMTGELATL